MLSGEGNAGECWKTTIGLISKKKQLCTCSTLFLYISLPLFCTTTTWNFQKLLSYTFYGGNVVRVPVHFLSLPLIIFTLHWWPLAFLILSPPLQNFHVVLPTKKCLLCFLSLALNPCRLFLVELRSPVAHFLFSLSFSCSIFQTCGHNNLSKLNTLDNRDTETISSFRFLLLDSFVVSALQDAGGYVISRQNNLELHLGYHTCWWSYFTLICLWCGRTVSRAGGRCTVTWLPNFLGWVVSVYFIFLPMVLRWRALRARAPL